MSTEEVEPIADQTHQVDPLDVLQQLFSDEMEPHNMLATAFETNADEDTSSDELAGIALDTIRRYLHDCATEQEGDQ